MHLKTKRYTLLVVTVFSVFAITCLIYFLGNPIVSSKSKSNQPFNEILEEEIEILTSMHSDPKRLVCGLNEFLNEIEVDYEPTDKLFVIRQIASKTVSLFNSLSNELSIKEIQELEELEKTHSLRLLNVGRVYYSAPSSIVKTKINDEQISLNELKHKTDRFFLDHSSINFLDSNFYECKALFFQFIALYNYKFITYYNDKIEVLSRIDVDYIDDLYQRYIDGEITPQQAINSLLLLDTIEAKLAIHNFSLYLDLEYKKLIDTKIYGVNSQIINSMNNNENILGKEYSWRELKVHIESKFGFSPKMLAYILLSEAIRTNQSIETLSKIIHLNPVITDWHLKDAISKNNYEIFNLLYNRNELLYLSNNPTESFLVYSVRKGKFEIFSKMIENGVNVEEPILGGLDSLDVALRMTLSKSGGYQFVRKLLQQNKSIEHSHIQQLLILKVEQPEVFESLNEEFNLSYIDDYL